MVEPGLWAKIVERRVLPLLAGYFGLMWAFVQFLSFMVDRYGWPDRSIDLLLTAMLSGAPLALLLIWRIGAPGAVRFSGLDRALMATLALLCAGSVGWRYAQAPAGPARPVATAASTAATLPQTRREDQVSDLMIYAFDVSAVPDDAWLQYGLPLLAEYDLFFDGRFAPRSVVSTITPSLNAFLERNGVKDIPSASTAVRRRAALALGFRAIVGGRIYRDPQGLVLDVEIQRLRPDATLGPFRLNARDEWDAINQLAALIRTELAPPKALAQANDPDIRSVTTESLEAAKAYVEGNLRVILGNDRAGAAKSFDQAYALDPSFLVARYLGVTVNPEVTMADGLPALESMLPQLDVLPTSFRFGIQRFIARARADKSGERQVLEAWTQAAPWDRAPRLALAELRLNDDPNDAAALDAIKTLTLESGSASEMSTRADLFLRQRRIDDARMLAEQALLLDPTSYSTLLALASVETAGGHHARATEYIGQAQAARPDLISADIQRARLRHALGESDAALTDLDRLLARKLDQRQRELVLEAKIDVQIALGRIRAARASIDARTALPITQADNAIVQRYLPYITPLAGVIGEKAVREWLATAPTPSAVMRPYVEVYADLGLALAREQSADITAALDSLRAVYAAQAQTVDPRQFAPPELLARIYARPPSIDIDGVIAAVATIEQHLRAGLYGSDQYDPLIESASRFALTQNRRSLARSATDSSAGRAHAPRLRRLAQSR